MKLVAVADDFGIGVNTSRGIVRAHLEGPVTCASVMTTTGDHLLKSVELLGGAPGLELGLHVVLTGVGRPLTGGAGSGFVDREGNLSSLRKLWVGAFAGQVSRGAVVAEIGAQAAVFEKVIGRKPAYVDSHHHSHLLPGVREGFLEAMHLGVVAGVTRVTVEPPGVISGVASRRMARLAAHGIGMASAGPFHAAGVVTNDFFFGMLSHNDLGRSWPWADYFARLPEKGWVEWVVHPGELDETLFGRDPYIRQRVLELGALTDAGVREKWEIFARGRKTDAVGEKKPAGGAGASS